MRINISTTFKLTALMLMTGCLQNIVSVDSKPPVTGGVVLDIPALPEGCSLRYMDGKFNQLPHDIVGCNQGLSSAWIPEGSRIIRGTDGKLYAGSASMISVSENEGVSWQHNTLNNGEVYNSLDIFGFNQIDQNNFTIRMIEKNGLSFNLSTRSFNSVGYLGHLGEASYPFGQTEITNLINGKTYRYEQVGDVLSIVSYDAIVPPFAWTDGVVIGSYNITDPRIDVSGAFSDPIFQNAVLSHHTPYGLMNSFDPIMFSMGDKVFLQLIYSNLAEDEFKTFFLEIFPDGSHDWHSLVPAPGGSIVLFEPGYSYIMSLDTIPIFGDVGAQSTGGFYKPSTKMSYFVPEVEQNQTRHADETSFYFGNSLERRSLIDNSPMASVINTSKQIRLFSEIRDVSFTGSNAYLYTDGGLYRNIGSGLEPISENIPDSSLFRLPSVAEFNGDIYVFTTTTLFGDQLRGLFKYAQDGTQSQVTLPAKIPLDRTINIAARAQGRIFSSNGALYVAAVSNVSGSDFDFVVYKTTDGVSFTELLDASGTSTAVGAIGLRGAWKYDSLIYFSIGNKLYVFDESSSTPSLNELRGVSMAVHQDSTQLVVGTPLGVSISQDNGATWTDLNLSSLIPNPKGSNYVVSQIAKVGNTYILATRYGLFTTEDFASFEEHFSLDAGDTSSKFAFSSNGDLVYYTSGSVFTSVGFTSRLNQD
jgi:hypothetical protein